MLKIFKEVIKAGGGFIDKSEYDAVIWLFFLMSRSHFLSKIILFYFFLFKRNAGWLQTFCPKCKKHTFFWYAILHVMHKQDSVYACKPEDILKGFSFQSTFR